MFIALLRKPKLLDLKLAEGKSRLAFPASYPFLHPVSTSALTKALYRHHGRWNQSHHFYCIILVVEEDRMDYRAVNFPNRGGGNVPRPKARVSKCLPGDMINTRPSTRKRSCGDLTIFWQESDGLECADA